MRPVTTPNNPINNPNTTMLILTLNGTQTAQTPNSTTSKEREQSLSSASQFFRIDVTCQTYCFYENLILHSAVIT